MLRSWDFGLKNPELYYSLLSHPKNCLFRLGTGLLLAKIIFAGHGLIRILDPRFFFLSLPSRGFDLPTLGAGSRRICPQDHGAPLCVCVCRERERQIIYFHIVLVKRGGFPSVLTQSAHCLCVCLDYVEKCERNIFLQFQHWSILQFTLFEFDCFIWSLTCLRK